MPGLNMRSNNVTFVSIFKGHLVIKATAETAGAIERLNKENRKVWELHFNELEGFITKIEKEDAGEYGIQWKITVKADIDYVLTIPYGGGMSFSFFSKLANCDPSQMISIQTSYKEEKTRFFLRQNNMPIKAFWTKNNPKGLPNLEKVMIKGKETWDDSKQMAHIESWFAKYYLPKLSNLGFTPPAQGTGDGPKDDAPETDLDRTLAQKPGQVQQNEAAAKEHKPTNLGNTQAAQTGAIPTKTRTPSAPAPKDTPPAHTVDDTPDWAK